MQEAWVQSLGWEDPLEKEMSTPCSILALETSWSLILRNCQTPPQPSLVAQAVKNLPVMWEAWVQSLGQEDPLEKGMATLQYPCLESPMDRGAWWATVYGAAKHWTLLSYFHLVLL